MIEHTHVKSGRERERPSERKIHTLTDYYKSISWRNNVYNLVEILYFSLSKFWDSAPFKKGKSIWKKKRNQRLVSYQFIFSLPWLSYVCVFMSSEMTIPRAQTHTHSAEFDKSMKSHHRSKYLPIVWAKSIDGSLSCCCRSLSISATLKQSFWIHRYTYRTVYLMR